MEVQEYLPLTETSFFIILSLATAPKHGYAIMKEVETMSEKRVVLATGTLYSALRRMLEDDWIERVVDDNFQAGSSTSSPVMDDVSWRRRPAGCGSWST